MKGSVKGVPVVIIVLVSVIVLPLFFTMLRFHSQEMGELRFIRSQMPTPIPTIEASPSAELAPTMTPSPKGKVIPILKESTDSAK